MKKCFEIYNLKYAIQLTVQQYSVNIHDVQTEEHK